MRKSHKTSLNAPRHVKPRKQKATQTRPVGVPVAKDTESHAPRVGTKLTTVIAMLRRSKGASITEMAKATDWQVHSVRGLISGTIKKKLGLAVTSEQIDGNRRYRIVVA